MTDEQFDPWKSLASELGVDANEPAPPPPPTKVPTSSVPRAPTTGSSSAPPAPKKSSSDWMALAGELGIEVPPEPPAASTKRDPVAELLGFPPPPAHAPYGREEQRRKGDEDETQEKRFRDDDYPRDRWTTDDADEGMIRDIEESDEIVRLESVGEGDGPRSREKGKDDARGSSRRRRRRGGRGRGEGRDRNAEVRGRSDSEGRIESRSDERKNIRREDGISHDDRDEVDDDEKRESEDINSSMGGVSGESPRRADGDEPQQKRRRRGRRGRGGSRERGNVRSERPSSPIRDVDDNLSPAPISTESEEIDFVELVDDDRTPLEPVGITADTDDNGDEDLASVGESHGGKNSVRDILTWKEAIGMIIDGNMQARSRAPQNSHGSHGSHGSRGRGRGRGRGGHRGG